jgi:hypothetical protein
VIKRLFWFAVIMMTVATLVSRSQSKRRNAYSEEEVAKSDWEAEGGAPAPDAI